MVAILIPSFFHAIVIGLTMFVLVIQILDVISTNSARRLPWVREVGDQAIGLGNLSGLAQRHLGWWWWIVKLPLALIFAPLIWTPAPLAVQPAIILLLLAANSYFLKITRQNFLNAVSNPPKGFYDDPGSH